MELFHVNWVLAMREILAIVIFAAGLMVLLSALRLEKGSGDRKLMIATAVLMWVAALILAVIGAMMDGRF